MILPTPSPRSVQVCSVCRGDWDAHTDLATARAWMYVDTDAGDPVPTVEVTLLDCIGVLLAAQRGPAGPPGPQGAMGNTGPPGAPGGG